jgi:hypothetical protein
MRIHSRLWRPWALGALAAGALVLGCNALIGLDISYTEVACLGAGCPDGSTPADGQGTGGATSTSTASTSTTSTSTTSTSTGTGGAGSDGGVGDGGDGGTLPTDVPEAANLVLWLRGEDWNGSIWPDRSPIGALATIYYGQVGVGSLNGLSVAAFDGNGDLVIQTIEGYPHWSGLTVMTVMTAPNANGGIVSFGSSFNNVPCYMFPPGGASSCVEYDQLEFNALMTLQQCDPSIGTCWQAYGLSQPLGAGWVRLSGELTVGADPSYHVYLNGVDEGPIGHNQSWPYPAPWDTPRQSVIIGWGAVASGLFSGSVAEIIVYNTSISDASRQALDAYLAAKWGL